jgi:hypothetical protein
MSPNSDGYSLYSHDNTLIEYAIIFFFLIPKKENQFLPKNRIQFFNKINKVSVNNFNIINKIVITIYNIMKLF